MFRASSQVKQNLHQELKLSYREYFESKLAVGLLEEAKQFQSIKKMSKAILKLLIANRKKVLEVIADNKKILEELSSPYFGACFDKGEMVSAEKILEKILSTLNYSDSSVSVVIQMHCIFIHRIYDHIVKNEGKKSVVEKIFPDYLFSKENRSRIEKVKGEVKQTNQYGISRNAAFFSRIDCSQTEHLRAIDRFDLDCKSTFFKNAKEKYIPIVCGPSGHTGSLLLGVKLYGDLSQEEMKEYALICFGFLAAGGNHSFHEVMVVANLVGVDFVEGDYAVSLPESFLKTELCERLRREFPEFLSFPSATIGGRG